MDVNANLNVHLTPNSYQQINNYSTVSFTGAYELDKGSNIP